MRIDIITIFPEYLAPLELSLVGKAQASGILDVRVHDLRDWTTDRHRTVDDTPVGGGAGMVMRPDVWGRALDDVSGWFRQAQPPEVAASANSNEFDLRSTGVDVETTRTNAHEDRATPHLIIPTPSGALFNQRDAELLARDRHLVFACGRYEGIDDRVAEYARQRGVRVSEYSIGEYVLNGGEVVALVLIEAVARLLPGVVGNPQSLVEESYANVDGGTGGLLEYPVYTRPISWAGLDVPDVLLSGHHKKIARWRRDQAFARTTHRRPDLLARLDPETLDRSDRETLRVLGWEVVDGRLVAADS